MWGTEGSRWGVVRGGLGCALLSHSSGWGHPSGPCRLVRKGEDKAWVLVGISLKGTVVLLGSLWGCEVHQEADIGVLCGSHYS